MSENDISRHSNQQYRGNAPLADSPIMGGTRSAPIGDANSRNLYESEQFSDGKGRMRHGSPIFYALLHEMATTHDRKSHDYASDDSPYANYEFAGKMSQLFDDSRDAGFVGRLGEKLFRLANLENSGKIPANETIEDTERDCCVIMTLWMASRRDRRMKESARDARSIGPLTKG